MKPKKKLLITLLVMAVIVAVWLIANPPGRFGWACYGYSTYDIRPRFVGDYQVRSDGAVRPVTKTHQLSFEMIEWLLEPRPDVLIIALGWDGVTVPDERIREYQGCEIHILKNKEALALFNRLKTSGRRVAIHYHSTC